MQSQKSGKSTRRKALAAIGGILVGTGAAPAVSGKNSITEIDEPTNITEPGRYKLVSDIKLIDTSVSGGGEWVGIEINSDDVRLDGNGHTIYHTGESGFYHHGLRVREGRNVRIRDVTVTGVNARPLEFNSGTQDGYLLNCESYNNAEGVSIGGDGIKIMNSKFHDNVFSGANPGVNGTFVNNQIYENGSGGIVIGGSESHISSNEIIENDGPGIRISRSNNITITGNRLCDNTEPFVIDEESSNNTIRGNRVCK